MEWGSEQDVFGEPQGVEGAGLHGECQTTVKNWDFILVQGEAIERF